MTVEDVTCIANISPEERRKRLMAGVIGLGFAVVVLAALIFFDATRWWRPVLFAPFYLAASGFFQWREKT
jgi:hypothetical protein